MTLTKREHATHIKLSHEEKDAVRRIAEQHGMSMSAWLRFVLRQQLGLSPRNDRR